MLGDIRDDQCTKCKLHQTAENVCITGTGPRDAKVMVVGRMPDSRSYREQMATTLSEVGIDPAGVFFTSAVKCRTFDQDVSTADIKACREYLDAEIALVKPDFVITLGNEALTGATGRSGITKYRGRPIEREGYTVLPTVSPAAVRRNPGQTQGYLAELRSFANKISGIEGKLGKPKVIVVDTPRKVRAVYRLFEQAAEMHYDIETTMGDEFRPDSRIISFAATMVFADGSTKCVAIPLYHPESPFRRSWRSVLRYLAPALQAVPKQIAHNGKFDARWLRHFGVMVRVTFDTMLAQALLDENRQKGLKPLGVSRLGVDPWGVDKANLLAMPLREVLEYNVLDTWYMRHIYIQLKAELQQNPRLLAIFRYITTNANNDLIDTERRGVWIDVDRLKKRKPEVQIKLDEIEAKIMEWVPDRDSTPTWPTDSRGRKVAVNFNASKFARWFLFDHLEMPVLARGKNKPNGDPGDPSMAEDVMLQLRDDIGHPVIQLLLDRSWWFKALSSFFNAYEELVDDEHRIHTTFKLAGTVTGRLSSGKADEDKITQRTSKSRGVNLQQVPRDPLVRGLFGAPPGWTWVEADFSQIELRIVAYIARVDRMLRAYATGEDIHLVTTASVTGLPIDQITKEVRKKIGKPVNFGFIYGMGWRKFIYTAFNNYGAVFSEAEARAYRTRFFELYPELLSWHARQRSLVEKYGRVSSPIGRIRHLPDIRSADDGVRHEAERQAINSPVQGFASDMTQLSMVLINRRARKDNMQDVVRCVGSVHDALNFEIRDDAVGYALPLIKDTMENLPFKKLFGIEVDVPIIADLKVGTHWGDARELEAEEVYAWAS